MLSIKARKKTENPAPLVPLWHLNKSEGPVQETQEDSGLLGQLLCAFRGRNCSENSDFRQKTEMHDREANRSYRNRTAESKYLSAVGPSEAELLLSRMGLRPK